MWGIVTNAMIIEKHHRVKSRRYNTLEKLEECFKCRNCGSPIQFDCETAEEHCSNPNCPFSFVPL